MECMKVLCICYGGKASSDAKDVLKHLSLTFHFTLRSLQVCLWFLIILTVWLGYPLFSLTSAISSHAAKPATAAEVLQKGVTFVLQTLYLTDTHTTTTTRPLLMIRSSIQIPEQVVASLSAGLVASQARRAA